jgi:hypothetical protein
MVDEIMGPTGGQVVGQYELAEIFKYDFLGFAFLSSELETQTENKNIFKINLIYGIF